MKLLASFALGVVGLFVLLSTLVTGSIYANPVSHTCQVPGDYSTIQDALNDVTCGVIEVGIGTFKERLIVDHIVTITGQGAANTILDGDKEHRVIKAEAGASLTLNDLTISNGLSPFEQGSGIRQPGAGIFISNGELRLTRANVLDNVGGFGTGIYAKDSIVIVEESLISGNKEVHPTASGGGGILLEGNSDAEITSSIIRDNHATGLGGGIRITNGTLAISDTTFIDNVSKQGGAVDNSRDGYAEEAAAVTISNSIFTGNKADAGTVAISVGGAIYNGYLASMSITSSTISGNEGIASNIQNDGELMLRDSKIISNTGTAIGNSYNGNLEIVRCEINENRSQYASGAIVNGGTMTVTENIIAGNYSSLNGGAVRNSRQLTIVDSIFKENTSTAAGGAIYNENSDSRVTISGSSFLNNVAGVSGTGANGGAIANERGTMTIDSSTIAGNHSGSTGGAIHNEDRGELIVTNSTISNNFTGQSGGAVLNDSRGLFISKNNTFYNNRAEYKGHTFYSGGNFNPEFRIVNSIIMADAGTNCAGTYDFTSLGHNVFSDSSCDPISSDIPDTYVHLVPLFYDGGNSLIYQLLPGSVAIDAGSDENCPSADQRGTARPMDGDLDGAAVCDIGAYEYDPANPPAIEQLFLPVIIKS